MDNNTKRFVKELLYNGSLITLAYLSGYVIGIFFKKAIYPIVFKEED